VWRDAVSEWFFHLSGIPDARGRVGHHLNRIEAEAMTSTGYSVTDVHPWETASGGKAVICKGLEPCILTTKLDFPAGEYDIAVQYFDLRGGVSHYDLLLNDNSIAHWAADDTLPPAVNDRNLDGHTSTRFTAHAVSIAPGDMLTLRGTPEGDEAAPVDYIEITPVTKETLKP
jgi:alpha-glucuronidase